MKGHLKQILFHTFVRQTQYALIVKSLIQLIKRHMQHSISKIAKYKHNTNLFKPSEESVDNIYNLHNS